MDVYCPVKGCGEPIDPYEFHDYAKSIGSTYEKVAADFRKRGCVAVGLVHSEGNDFRDSSFGLTANEAASALYDILGDDMDGAAAMLEDMGF